MAIQHRYNFLRYRTANKERAHPLLQLLADVFIDRLLRTCVYWKTVIYTW